MPIAGVHLTGLLDERGERGLDPDVVDLVAVVGEDDVDEVLADVVHVALDRADDEATLAAASALHVRLGTRPPSSSSPRLEHERELHLARAEQVAHDLHARAARR